MAEIKDKLEEIIKKAKEYKIDDLYSKEKAALTVYRKMAEALKGVNEASATQIVGGQYKSVSVTNKMRIGSPYLFQYKAKHADTLPYWDRFPLMIPIEFKKDGFMGLNLHYIDPISRAKLVFALLQTTNVESEKMRMNVTYQLLKNSSKYREFKPCLKRYLSGQLQSRFFEINMEEFPIFCFLPLQRFLTKTKYASAQQVWIDSTKLIRGNK